MTGTVYTINGKSTDYGWDIRNDGVEGIVVWKGDWWIHLAKGTDICFTDKTIDTDYLFSGSTGGGSQSGSVYTINGNSSDYGWDIRNDGVEGIVVWKGNWWIHLAKGTDIKFADKTVDTDYLFSGSTGGGSTGGGSTSGTVYTINGNSSDYGWDVRNDGVEGIVVWKGDWWVHLAKGTDICFNDKTVDTDYLFSGSTGGGSTGGGTSGTVYTINGNSSDYGWDVRNDGVEGIVVWKGDWWVHLPKGTDICFNDKIVDTDYLFTGGGSQNRAPVANDDAASGAAGTTVKGNVLGNDTDPDGDTLKAVLTGTTQNGTLVLNADGSFTYTPKAGFTGTDSFTYYAEDGKGACDDATVTITVTGGNPPPPPPGNTASLGDKVWLDANKNGVQDAGETGIAGVTVTLKDSTGKAIATTQTDAQGNYLFDKLAAGNYQVGVTAPAQYELTAKDAFNNGADGIDSDINAGNGHSDTITLKDGEKNTTVDAGLVQKVVEPVKTASIGDRVWLDANKNGLQDAGEAGVAGVTVQLKDASGTLLATQQTDANGNYLFDKLAAGNYQVGVTAPSQYQLTAKDAFGNGADGVDSDVNVSTSHTDTIALKEGEAIRTVDAGLVEKTVAPTASLGDLVFEDLNFNGVQDAGEKGIAGVTVNLTDANGNVLKTMTTDANGNYKFTELAAGDYKVNVQGPNGYYVTKSNIGDDAKDSDIGANGMTGVIRLNDGQQDLTVDAGLYRKAIIGDQVWWDDDHDGIKDSGLNANGRNEELGVSGVTVRLIDANNNVVATTITGTNGYYRFVDVDPGQYQVEFSAKGATMVNGFYGNINADTSGWNWAKVNIGNNDEIDADAGGTAITNIVRTDVFGVISGQCDLTRDAAVTPIMLDLNGDGQIGVTGETTSQDKSGITSVGHTVSFDINADGVKDQIEWSDGKGDGFLVDMSKIGADGEIDGSALFGDEGGKYANGYDKLAQHDANGDGSISGDELVGLGLWIDNGDAVIQDGEIKSATDLHVTSISADMQIAYDDAGRALMQATAEVNGQTILTEDVWFAQAQADEPVHCWAA